MNYELYLLSKLLIDNGVVVNGVMFESMPYDEQYDLIPHIWDYFAESKHNTSDKDLCSCIIDYLISKKMKIDFDMDAKSACENIDRVISICKDAINNNIDFSRGVYDDNKQMLNDMIMFLYKAKYHINK